MNKRLIVKTSLICTGIYIILASLAIFFVSSKYELDTENRYNVIVASKDIAAGDIITEANAGIKVIKESAYTAHMLTDPSLCIGRKALTPIKSGDYLMSYSLLSPEAWHKDDEKIIVLPMSVEERLANCIQKGSLIDIKVLPENQKTIPKTVLSRIAIDDILDENGMSLGDSLGNKKAFAVVTLDEKQRERLYVAQQVGKIIYELYCDSTQPKAPEDFEIPAEFLHAVPAVSEESSGQKTENAPVNGPPEADATKNSIGGRVQIE